MARISTAAGLSRRDTNHGPVVKKKKEEEKPASISKALRSLMSLILLLTRAVQF